MSACLVCAAPVADASPFVVFFRGAPRRFCGHACRIAFKREPERYVPVAAAPAVVRPDPAARAPSPFVVRAAPRRTKEA